MENDDKNFNEIVFMESDGTVIKRLKPHSRLPRKTDYILYNGKSYIVDIVVFDYDLECIKVWVQRNSL